MNQPVKNPSAAKVGGGAIVASLVGILLLFQSAPVPAPELPPLPIPTPLPVTETAFPAAVSCHGPTVIDGDTFRCARPAGIPSLRLWGIDAPETGQPRGDEAKAALAGLLSGPLTVTAIAQDRYGRLVVKVRTWKAPDISTKLVESGLAWWSPQYAPEAIDIRQAEDKARAGKLGIWKDASPIAPWNWRSKARKEEAHADQDTGKGDKTHRDDSPGDLFAGDARLAARAARRPD